MSDLNRERFEEWFEESGLYKFKETAWTAWEASRGRLVIELPEKWGDFSEIAYGRDEGIDACAIAIHEAGVKTK